MNLDGKVAKSTRMHCSTLRVWKSSSLTSSVCTKKGSGSLVSCTLSTWNNGRNLLLLKEILKMLTKGPHTVNPLALETPTIGPKGRIAELVHACFSILHTVIFGLGNLACFEENPKSQSERPSSPCYVARYAIGPKDTASAGYLCRPDLLMSGEVEEGAPPIVKHHSKILFLFLHNLGMSVRIARKCTLGRPIVLSDGKQGHQKLVLCYSN
jgi:hypothetical protein